MGRRMEHGWRGTRTYNTWVALRRRCDDKNHKAYSYYGGRGITYCPTWKDFKKFLADMGPCPVKHTIERIDNNGNYGPDNCRWATRKEQRQNRRR